jgi:hypothetical protein
MLAPVIPLPMITTSAEEGRPLVDRWPRSSGDGSVCQNESVDFGVGRPAGWLSLGRSGIVRAIVVGCFVGGNAYTFQKCSGVDGAQSLDVVQGSLYG